MSNQTTSADRHRSLVAGDIIRLVEKDVGSILSVEQSILTQKKVAAMLRDHFAIIEPKELDNA